MEFEFNQPDLYTESSHLNFFSGWSTKPNFERVKAHLNSVESIFAVERGNLVGMITALTDKTMFAFIPLLEVREEFQGKGLGTKLVNAMESHLGKMYSVDLVCDQDVVPFYKGLGFTEWTAMIKRDRSSL